MFPYIMIATALIFFSDRFHEKVLTFLQRVLSLPADLRSDHIATPLKSTKPILIAVLSVFFVSQLVIPFRYIMYPGKLYWTEQGFRFSWRVMLMEKSGLATFRVIDESGKYLIVNNKEFLTPMQEKMMATQPDMILQYAHILRDFYTSIGYNKPAVYVDSYVALNGRRGRAMVDPNVNLALEKESFRHKPWILLYND
jgi:hypothetical protein